MATGCTDSRTEESTPIDLDAAPGDVLGAAQRTFPTFCLPPDVLIAYLRERLPPDLPPPIALRQHDLDGATLDELAPLYRVHRSTTARILGRAREMVLGSTRDRLMSELDVPSQELDRILQMIWSRIEFSLRALRRGGRR